MSVILWGYQQVQQKLIDLWKADPSLSEPGKVKKYCFGRPVSLSEYPLIYVQFLGGPLPEQEGSVRKEVHVFDFEAVVADRHPDEDVSEKAVEDFAESMQMVVRGDRSLGGLVDSAFVVDVARGELRLLDYSLHAVKVVVRCRKIA
ncbi:MAG: hypothetical protein HYU39_04635 [Thaumarchaeota archaeon]|nr:hypothetical protein [Nitrososphaerota archaeon]